MQQTNAKTTSLCCLVAVATKKPKDNIVKQSVCTTIVKRVVKVTAECGMPGMPNAGECRMPRMPECGMNADRAFAKKKF